MEAVGDVEQGRHRGAAARGGAAAAAAAADRADGRVRHPRDPALATPATGARGGPRMTWPPAGGDDGTDEDGLTPKGQAIYKKLIAKGFPAARAVAFAKMSQKTKPGQFGKQAAA